MALIAFDVGVKNLSYCVLDDSSVISWNIINVSDGIDEKSSKDFHTIAEALFSKLDSHFSDVDVSHVVIENQPVYKNPTMKSIQMMLYSFFAMRNLKREHNIKLSFIAASTKVKYAERVLKENCPDDLNELKKTKNKYAYNKKSAVHCVKLMIESSSEIHFDDHLVTRFSDSKKKDDLADAFLLALVHKEKVLKGKTRLSSTVKDE